MKKLFLKKGKKKEVLSKSSILYKDFGIEFREPKSYCPREGADYGNCYPASCA
jgi:hypothetical protein